MAQMVPGLLSVVLANYNHANVVADQIAAVLAQSYRNFEFIILDDVSTDNSVAVIQAATRGDPRVIFVQNERNLGVVANFDKGRQIARGEFLATIASDDRVLPGYFEYCISALQQVPQAAFCCADPAQFHKETLQINPNPLRWSSQPAYLDPDMLAELMCGQHIGSWAAIFRVKAYNESMPPQHLWARLRWTHDWFLSHVMAFRHGICYIPGVLAALRVDPAGFAQTGFRDWEKQKDVMLAVFELLRLPAYADVVPHFARGGLLSLFPGVVRLVMSRPDLWDPQTLMLIQRPLFEWNVRMNQVLMERAQAGAPANAPRA